MAIYESADGIQIETDDNATDAQIQAIFNAERQQKGAPQGAPQAPQDGAQNPALLNMMQGNVAQAPQAQIPQGPTLLQRMGNAVSPVADAIQPFVKPAMQTMGAVGGGLVGALGGPAGAVLGGAGGYAAGSQLGDVMNNMGGYSQPQSMGQTVQNIGNDVATGMAMELAGPLAGKALSGMGSLAQKMIPNTWKQAANAGPEFMSAMRKNVSGEEISNIAKQGVQDIKSGRAADYRATLGEISKIKTDVPMPNTFSAIDETLAKYGIKELPDGSFDLSRSTVGSKGQKDIKEVLDLFSQWGTKVEDKTPAGVDLLRRRVGDIYSDSSQANGFVTAIKNSLKSDISTVVPEYAKMTKGYEEASSLLRDMVKITGKNNKADADLVIKRVVSAMKDDVSVKNELLRQITNNTGNNLEQMAAGYAMSKWIPQGITGRIAEGGVLGLGAFGHLFTPAAAAALLASSPRIRGEAVRVIGKALMKAPASAEAAIRTGGILARNIGGTEE